MIIMKNIIKLSCALAAALSVISCNEKIGSEISEPGDYITVSSDVAPHTKAGYEGTSVLPENFFIDIDQTGTEKDYKETLTRVESSNKYIFPDNVKPKWASSDYSSVMIKAITTPSNYNRDNGTISISQNQSTDTAVMANDLLGAWTGNGIEISSGNVVVHFNHLMSKLYVKYNTSNVEVSSISLNNICTSGTFNFQSAAYAPGSTGNISMLHNTSDDTAEAIFFPYEPSLKNAEGEGTGMPELSVKVDGKALDPLPISLDKVGGKFLPGKRYIMNVTITGSTIEGAEVTVSEWTPDITTITTPGENVLWVGTSIPAGNASLNYPDEVDRAMTCSITNVAVGGSLVCPQLNAEWVKEDHFTNYDGFKQVMKLMGGALSQTKDEISSLYRSKLLSVSKNDNEWTNEVLAEMQSLSYESLIIPYINGEKGNCTTVILDHGFNDLSNMIYIAGVFRTPGEHVRGYEYLRKMRDKEKTVAEYEQDILNNPNNVSLNASYIHAMAKVIDAIKAEANRLGKDIRIIIGNYFSLYSPYVARQYQTQHEREYTYTVEQSSDKESYKLVQHTKNPAYQQFPDYATFSNLICYYNEAIAGIYDLDIVNVYEHIAIPESMFWGGTQQYYYPEPVTDEYGNHLKDDNGDPQYTYKPVFDTDGTTPVHFDTSFNPSVRNDQSKFCPDGVHPSNPAAVGAIAEIYIDHLDGIVGSRGQDHTSASTSSVKSNTAAGVDTWDEEEF